MRPDDERRQLARDWLSKAREDPLAAERSNQAPPLVNIVLYNCQQTAEKAFKAFLTWQNEPFRRTHDLSELLQRCHQIDQQFRALVGPATTLNQYASQTRYPGGLMLPTAAEADFALRLAREVQRFVEARVP